MKVLTILIMLIITGCAGFSPELGIDKGRFSECPDSPNCVSTMAEDERGYIKPIVAVGPSVEIKNKIILIVNQFKRSRIVIVEDNYIRAEFSSQVFRFVDDVEFYFPETKTDEMIIHIRSASRIGYSDMGVNRKRVEDIRKAFENMSAE